jgi:hypothetical protein
MQEAVVKTYTHPPWEEQMATFPLSRIQTLIIIGTTNSLQVTEWEGSNSEDHKVSYNINNRCQLKD